MRYGAGAAGGAGGGVNRSTFAEIPKLEMI
jgi:hypothetical protein